MNPEELEKLKSLLEKEPIIHEFNKQTGKDIEWLLREVRVTPNNDHPKAWPFTWAGVFKNLGTAMLAIQNAALLVWLCRDSYNNGTEEQRERVSDFIVSQTRHLMDEEKRLKIKDMKTLYERGKKNLEVTSAAGKDSRCVTPEEKERIIKEVDDFLAKKKPGESTKRYSGEAAYKHVSEKIIKEKEKKGDKTRGYSISNIKGIYTKRGEKRENKPQ
ncbi:hypothetical protein [Desulfobotulus mexicanus]|uniref:Uncharacterized protein n=1 Tax=Desulfobotulus mexicanus TaxID=2586642 RepID=A0A5S5MF14_9BACT|nr:hypothetical protein [Desulfobotulus mexicanus]TYT74321.1 hypothetical protein FIM25_10185 [Desulfobotulus mexicanus]